MTQDNNIWHTHDDVPEREQVCVWQDSQGIHGGRFDTCYRCFCGPASYFVDLRKVKRWATAESLIASSKALDVAIDSLDAISNWDADNPKVPFNRRPYQVRAIQNYAKNVLRKITKSLQ